MSYRPALEKYSAPAPPPASPKGPLRLILQLHAILLDQHASLPAATVRYHIARIREVDRRLAVTAISDAQSAGGNGQQIASAMNELNEGDAFCRTG